MADIKFNTHFNRVTKPEVTKFEKNDFVERAGYVPLRNQIRAFREAGVLLKATRALQYDVADDGSKALDKINPIFASGGVDYSDMTELSNRQAALGKVVENLRNPDVATSTTGTPVAEPSSEK